jgi:hypothetical protein
MASGSRCTRASRARSLRARVSSHAAAGDAARRARARSVRVVSRVAGRRQKRAGRTTSPWSTAVAPGIAGAIEPNEHRARQPGHVGQQAVRCRPAARQRALPAPRAPPAIRRPRGSRSPAASAPGARPPDNGIPRPAWSTAAAASRRGPRPCQRSRRRAPSCHTSPAPWSRPAGQDRQRRQPAPCERVEHPSDPSGVTGTTPLAGRGPASDCRGRRQLGQPSRHRVALARPKGRWKTRVSAARRRAPPQPGQSPSPSGSLPPHNTQRETPPTSPGAAASASSSAAAVDSGPRWRRRWRRQPPRRARGTAGRERAGRNPSAPAVAAMRGRAPRELAGERVVE